MLKFARRCHQHKRSTGAPLRLGTKCGVFLFCLVFLCNSISQDWHGRLWQAEQVEKGSFFWGHGSNTYLGTERSPVIVGRPISGSFEEWCPVRPKCPKCLRPVFDVLTSKSCPVELSECSPNPPFARRSFYRSKSASPVSGAAPSTKGGRH